jgi:hypothetical protein
MGKSHKTIGRFTGRTLVFQRRARGAWRFKRKGLKHWPNLRHDDAACGVWGTWRIPAGGFASQKSRVTCSRCRRLCGLDDGKDKRTLVRRPKVFRNCVPSEVRRLRAEVRRLRAANRRLRIEVRSLRESRPPSSLSDDGYLR